MKKFTKNDAKSIQTIFLLSFFVIMASQIQFSLFYTHFKISLGIVCLPVLLYLLEDVPIIPISIISGLGVSSLRWFLYNFSVTNDIGPFSVFYPETFFYVIYGISLNYYAKKNTPFFNAPLKLLPYISMDYIANLTEILIRKNVPVFSLKTQGALLLVALLRTFIIFAILFSCKRYHLVLLHAEHANRYEKLLLLYSKLGSEIEWMKKNTVNIEETMNKTYNLYYSLKKKDHPLSTNALEVARDIHEIKKEYNIILLGLSETLDLNVSGEGMYMEDILSILKNSMTEFAETKNKKLILSLNLTKNIYTNHHYYYMGIFRNLITNAIEASTSNEVIVTINETISDDHITMTVCDNGPGILNDDISHIFEPGFSTKINYETGEISRGLGLGLVKELVTKTLNGDINVTSKPGNTTFTLLIPLEKGAIY